MKQEKIDEIERLFEDLNDEIASVRTHIELVSDDHSPLLDFVCRSLGELQFQVMQELKEDQ